METIIKQPRLVDAQQMATMYPDTFEVPNHEELNAISEGDSVKVCAPFTPISGVSAERFWVTVKSKTGDIIEATVDNHLLYTSKHGLDYGDTIKLHVHHVYEILQSCQAESNSDSPSV